MVVKPKEEHFQENSSKTILAVDDDAYVRKMFNSMLGNKGFNVITARDGAEAVTKALNYKPDLIFLDVMMPEVDGFAALEMLRKMEQTQDIPVIIATARSDTRTLLHAIKLGANDFIAKPFTRAMIMRKVKFAVMKPEIIDDVQLDADRNEINRKTTFINSSAFLEMKLKFVFNFDQSFVSMVRHLSQRNYAALNKNWDELESACHTYEIKEPLKIITEARIFLKEANWSETTNRLEKIYAIFKKLQDEMEKEDNNSKKPEVNKADKAS